MKRYQALVNISVPQRSGAPADQAKNDIAYPGDIVELTEAEARHLMTCAPVPLIRPLSEEQQEMPVITGRQVTGRIQGPPVDARPDPPNSSHVQVFQQAGAPELNEPAPGSEQGADAIDLPAGIRIEGGLSRR
jgi:hypothetical protein